MSIDRVRAYLDQWNRGRDILELTVSTATVTLAAEAIGVPQGRIAKSVTVRKGDGGLLLVVSGDVKVANRKFKEYFGFSPRLLNPQDAQSLTGFSVGGICPFALPDGIEVYLDHSLRRYETVYPACGNSQSLIQVTLSELAEYSNSRGWVDVCIEPPVDG